MLSLTLPLTKLHLRLLDIFALCPYEWPANSPIPKTLLPAAEPRKKLVAFKLNVALHTLYGIVVTGNFLLTLDSLHISRKMISLVYISSIFVSLALRFNFIGGEKSGWTEIIISCYQFEKRNPTVSTDRSSPTIKLLNAVQLTGFLSSFSMPGFTGMLLYVDPAMPPFLGYILKCWGASLGSQAVAGGSFWYSFAGMMLIFLDLYIWFCIVATVTFFAFNGTLIPIQLLKYYLTQSGKFLSGSNGGSGTAARNNGIHVYRQVQLLGILINEVCQGLAIPSVMIGGWNALVIGTYAIVKLHDDIPMPGFAFFPVMLSDGLCVALMVKIAAGVLGNSEECLEIAKNNCGGGRIAVHKRVVRSMGRVKTKIGEANHIDQLTPLLFVNTAVDKCVNIMLIS